MRSPTPISTYRLQLHAGFTFEDARAIAPYLDELGVSDVYVSPILRAEKGSTHGYNVCAHDQVSPELGGEEGFRALSDELRRRGLRLLVDFVPNHMGIATGENSLWNDVLENGPSSRFADFFDIDWEPGKASLHARVLYPILGAQYGEALENGRITLAREGGSFILRCYEHRLPTAPRSLLPLFELALSGLRRGGPSATSDPDVEELESIRTATRNLPEREERSEDRRAERAREKEVNKRRLEALCQRSDRVARALDGAIAEYNGLAGDPRSWDKLDALLREQNFRLSYWRVATEEINYRRFFDINQLAAVRIELLPVFEEAHAKLFELVKEGRVDGLRLDHTDGLYDPYEYFRSLRRAAADGEPGEGAARRHQGLYVVAEKILEPGERLPRAWEIDGTTGYDVLPLLYGVWVDGRAEEAFTSLYRRFTGDTRSFEAHVCEGKRAVVRSSFGAEMNVLARALERIAEANRRSCDFTLASLHDVIVEAIVAFPVYRTYVRADGSRGPNDDRHIAQAIAVAKRRNLDVDPSIFDFLRDILLLREVVPETSSFAMRFQQLTGPIMAKGSEDTAFYRYGRLACLNEVGGDPSHFGTSVRQLHEAAQVRARDWPLSMVASSTHDTKRGEDVRARLAVLTEQPERWEACVQAWGELAKTHVRTMDDAPAPSAGDQYLFFQTVLGAWPFAGALAEREAFADRIAAYMEKAAREAKVGTSWLHPNADYERALADFVHGMLADAEFLRSVRQLAEETATFAATNGLASVALKIMGPGVADTYQGCELWSCSLVDPDSRREVDYQARSSALRALRERLTDREGLARELLGRFEDGAVKLYVTHALLALRRELPSVVVRGSYRPIDGGEHVVAFVREEREEREGESNGREQARQNQQDQQNQKEERERTRTLACVTPRLPWKLTGGEARWAVGSAWGDRSLPLPPGRWRNVLTGTRHCWTGDAPMREVLGSFPIAVLLAERDL